MSGMLLVVKNLHWQLQVKRESRRILVYISCNAFPNYHEPAGKAIQLKYTYFAIHPYLKKREP